VLLQVQQRPGSLITQAPNHDDDFVKVDGGHGRACRGANSTDNSDTYLVSLRGYVWRGNMDSSGYLLAGAGDSTVDQCRTLCRNIPHCAGIEVDGEKCEIWTRAEGIETSTPVAGHSCWRYEPAPGASPVVAADPRFSLVDGGFQRACRDKDGAHVESDFKRRTARNVHDCQQLCVEDPECLGIEYDEGWNPVGDWRDRANIKFPCELWTTPIGSTQYKTGYWCMTRKN